MVKRRITIKFKVGVDSDKFMEKCLKIFKNIDIIKQGEFYILKGGFRGNKTSYDFHHEFMDLNMELHCKIKIIADYEELIGYEEEFTITKGKLEVIDFKHIHIDKLKELSSLKKDFWEGFDKMLSNNQVSIYDTDRIYDLCTNYLWEDGYYQEILQNNISSLIFEYIVRLNSRSDTFNRYMKEADISQYFNMNIEEMIKNKVVDFPY